MRNIPSYERFVVERAVPLDDILRTDTKQGLVMKDSGSGGDLTRELGLYDFDDKVPLAYIAVKRWRGSSSFEVLRSVAVKDYGPDIYDLALMSVHPEAIVPAGTIKPEAVGVWKYYLERRPDVGKEPIPPGDPDYKTAYDADVAHAGLRDPSTLRVLNVRYSLRPSAQFEALLQRGDEYSRTYRTQPLKICSQYFYKRYDH